MTLMSRKMFFIVAVAIAVSLVATVGRLFVGIPFLPPSGREVVARLSGLPIPVFVSSEDAVDECSPFFCMDYYGRGLIRLDPSPCAKAIDAAKAQGWRPLPLPVNIGRSADIDRQGQRTPALCFRGINCLRARTWIKSNETATIIVHAEKRTALVH